MPYRAYKNESGEYMALEYEYDGPPEPDYEDYEISDPEEYGEE